eukprot:g9217.t1
MDGECTVCQCTQYTVPRPLAPVCQNCRHAASLHRTHSQSSVLPSLPIQTQTQVQRERERQRLKQTAKTDSPMSESDRQIERERETEKKRSLAQAASAAEAARIAVREPQLASDIRTIWELSTLYEEVPPLDLLIRPQEGRPSPALACVPSTLPLEMAEPLLTDMPHHRKCLPMETPPPGTLIPPQPPTFLQALLLSMQASGVECVRNIHAPPVPPQ